MDLGLQDSVYVVTGATRGLGRATATSLVDEGARVIVSGRHAEHVKDTVDALGAQRCVGRVGDNADPATAGRLVKAAVHTYGRLDGALISVGGPPLGGVMQVPDDQWRQSFESIFLGAVRIARAVVTELREGGSIAFVLSSSVRIPLEDMVVSGGLRPGLAAIAKSMADELGQYGIRVNSLLPSRIDTERVRELDALTEDPRLARQQREAQIPLRRYGEMDEFARVATFVLSPAASYVTGAAIPVDGGAIRSL